MPQGYLGFVDSLIFIHCGKGAIGGAGTKEHAKMWTKFCLDHVPKGSAVKALKLVPNSN